MDLTKKEIINYLEELQIPENLRDQCRMLTEAQEYDELYQSLRGARTQFLADMHSAQSRLDQLDRLIYDIKRKKRGNGK